MDRQGYYSLVQYVQDPQRDEGINCGVLLVVPDFSYLDIRIIDSSVRVLSLIDTRNKESIRAELKHVQSAVMGQSEKLLNDGTYHYLPVKNFGKMRFSQFKNLRIHDLSNPVIILNELFNSLVEVKEDSLLLKAVKSLLDDIKEDTFTIEPGKKADDGNIVVFRRAKELLEHADYLRDIIHD
jgi:hypothetical protein